MMQAAIDLHDVEFADVVIIGRISSYEVVLDPVVRERHQKTLARFPDMRKTLGDITGFLTDYARFDVLVDEVLRGAAPENLTVSWDNSTFSEPKDMPPGPFLIALREPFSPLPPTSRSKRHYTG